MRKQLLKERFHVMEIRNKFEAEMLKRIDDDFLGELIDQNDDTIDEIVLP